MADLLYIPQYKTTTLNVAGGIDNSQTTGIVLTDVSGVDSTKPGIVALTWADPLVTASVEFITYTSISSNELQGATRGQEGYSAKAHANQAVVAFILSKSHINRINDKLTAVDTGVSLSSPALTTPKITTSINDSGGNEVIKTPATASAVNEWTMTNAATGNNPVLSMTGGDTNIGMDLKMKGTGKYRRPTVFEVQAFGASTDTATGDGKAFFEILEELNGMDLIGVGAFVYTAGTTGTTDVQIRNITDTVDMLSTKITIDSAETSSRTAATPAVIDTTKDDVVTGDRIAIDVDAVSTTAAKGLVVWFRFQLPA